MSRATERFIRLYEKLVEEVNRRAGADSSHSFQIERAAARDRAVRNRERLLRYIRDVRHALQHPRHQSPGHAVYISDTFVQEVDSVLNYLIKPPTAKSVGVSLNEVKGAQVTDKLGDLADAMRRDGFSHLPVLDDHNVVIGVFNEAAVFDHLWSDSETIVGRNMIVSDILHHCRLDAGHTETFTFVNPRIPLDDLVDIFAAVESPTTRVGAAFVTASGKDIEPLQRLITPWDVLATSSGMSL